ncbi:MAG TPA: bifunctional 3-(3-hydroxy-phenyl)propionate/3-hydroxycinnamic acid hydroxylase [Acidiferrobacterales bacterium]|nr:bifunctional 3-(3-hydroxy-phenyl)propionate/3-hydroxycinnamic acid hydroxylase [Acidiferrobacterales bacterium]
MSTPKPFTASVLVVGAGPTGLTLANILGQEGVCTILIDRKPATVAEPRAVSIDDESLRTMQAIGLHEVVLKDVVPGYGVHYFTKPGGRCFGKVEPTVSEYGFPRRNAFRQPLFEATLLEGLRRFPSVRVLFAHTLEQVLQDAEGIAATVSRPDGSRIELRARYLAACDGGRSPLRKMNGVKMVGSSFEARWLVIDTEKDNDPFWQTRVYCDPGRPVVEVPGPHHTRRFELLLRSDEQEDEVMRPERIRELLRPFRGEQETHVVRRIVYTFHARVADQWRIGKIFLAGDAAHLTPPYAGQGMNSGIRDAHNLGWKLAAVVQAKMGDVVLNSYETERRAHAWSLIQLALNLGVVMAPKSPCRAFLLTWFFTLVGFIPPLRDYFLQMKFKPKPRFKSGLIIADGNTLSGRMLPQPHVTTADGDQQPLDNMIGAGFALISYGTEDSGILDHLCHPLWDHLAAVRVFIASPGSGRSESVPPGSRYRSVVDHDNVLASLLDDYRGKIILLRPDRYVAGVFSGEEEAGFADRYARLLSADTRLPAGGSQIPAASAHNKKLAIN